MSLASFGHMLANKQNVVAHIEQLKTAGLSGAFILQISERQETKEETKWRQKERRRNCTTDGKLHHCADLSGSQPHIF